MKKVPKKVLRYFLIIPRLQRLYKSSHIAKEMIWHATGKCTEPEPRNVRLGLAADGFNLFGNLSQAYNMWLVILTTYNLPLWLCIKESSFMLMLLIPGPKSPGKDIDVYLRPLIEDLKIAKPIIELCSLFKQICSATLMEDDMLKAQIKVVDILCDLELIYPPTLFDIMIHLVIHLPLEDLEGMPIRPRWMFPFERYMKKLKGYVQNKAKPECLIVEGYVAKALTFSSHYFRDVTTKFNRPDRNVDPAPQRVSFGCSNRYIRQHYVDNEKDPEVSITNELFALACGPTWTPISINSYVVDGERNNMTQIDTRAESFKDDQYILITQVKQVFYLEDKAKPYWRVVEHVNHKNFSDGGVIVVEDDPDIIHFDNSSYLLLFTSLNDLDNATLHIDGQSIEVDVPPDIIDVVDEDDDITDDEDVFLMI
nr:hypothetical protein [Tanacetum cinerariifolium]